MKIVLFDQASTALDSPTFEANGQVTVVALGLQPDDYITFEVVHVVPGAKVACGCRVSQINPALIAGTLELQCPSCESATLRPVRLTERNPVVVIDVPQNTLLRAIYHGDGIDLRTVNAWYEATATGDLSDAMRGCPPVCCEDEVQTWEETGERRCTDSTQTVEVRQVSNCGNYRWVADPVPPTHYWTETGVRRCVDSTQTVEVQEQNPCGEIRWVADPVPPTNYWSPTGERRCAGAFVEAQEQNPCGETRWTVTAEAVVWLDTGVTVCSQDGLTTQLEQTNQCGGRRLVAGPAQSWNGTGLTRCSSGIVEVQETNQCGQLRWVNTGTPVAWTDTGLVVCSLVNDVSTTVEQTNQCGERRMVAGPPQAWVATGVTRCTGAVVENQETNQCGRIRWVSSGTPVTWVGTGVRRCGEVFVELQETNQCGALRWVTTDEPIFWMPTGATACIDGAYLGEEENNCDLNRWVDLGDCPEVPYTLQSLVGSPLSAVEGSVFCWTVTLDRAVKGTQLVIQTELSGDEQTVHNYPAPTITIPVGQTSGQACVPTTDDVTLEPIRNLCLSVLGNSRFTTVGASSCVQVLDNDAVDSFMLISFVADDPTPVAGQQVCWTATTDYLVTGSTLQILTSDGLIINIPVGSNTGQVCQVVGCTPVNLTVTPGAGAGNPRLTGAPIAANVAPAAYNLVSLTRAPTSIAPGANVVFTGTLDTPIVGAARTVTINPGDGGGNVVLTFNTGSNTAVANRVYSTAGVFNPSYVTRSACINGTPAIGNVTVTAPAAVIIDISSPPGEVDPGEQICWTVTTDIPAPPGGLAFDVTVSGDPSPDGNVCGSYNGTTSGPVITVIPATVPAGATSTVVCYTVPA